MKSNGDQSKRSWDSKIRRKRRKRKKKERSKKEKDRKRRNKRKRRIGEEDGSKQGDGRMEDMKQRRRSNKVRGGSKKVSTRKIS